MVKKKALGKSSHICSCSSPVCPAMLGLKEQTSKSTKQDVSNPMLSAGEYAMDSGHHHPGSQSSCSACCLLRAGATSCIAARVVYLMLADCHINSPTLPANADPGLQIKNSRGTAMQFSAGLICLAIVCLGFLDVMSSNQALQGCFTLHMPYHGKPSTRALVTRYQGLGKWKKKIKLFLFLRFCI